MFLMDFFSNFFFGVESVWEFFFIIGVCMLLFKFCGENEVFYMENILFINREFVI